MSSPSSPKSLSPAALTALTASSAVTTMKAAPGPGSASPVEVSITPMPQRSQTRRRSSGRPRRVVGRPPQREQKRIVGGRSCAGRGRLALCDPDGHRRVESIRTRSPRDSPARVAQCTGSRAETRGESAPLLSRRSPVASYRAQP